MGILLEIILGTKLLHFHAKIVECANCGGKGGWRSRGKWIVCDWCNGTGTLEE